jgi:response regulator RpfG family c-di-GMP phosphodiesterase
MNPPKNLVLVVDDDPQGLTLIQEILNSIPCNVICASRLEEAREQLVRNPELSVVLCDQFLPDGNGLAFFQQLKKTHPLIVRILITGFPEADIALAAINDGEIFRFISKPYTLDQVTLPVREALEKGNLIRENIRLQEALVSGNHELQKTNASLQHALSNSIKLCLDLLDRFDHVLASHCARVAKWSRAIAKTFSLSPAELETLDLAAQMHDIGLISVSRSYHAQQQIGWDDLPYLQQTALQMHPKTGAELVGFLHEKHVPEVILAHHEWFNGNGYPSHLTHEDVPLLASILAVPDAYDELPMERAQAAKFIEENLGTRFHPEVGRAFLRLLEEEPNFALPEREVLINELQPGMKATCNILSASGVMLVPKGQELTSKLIQYIHQHDQSEPLTQRIFVLS